MVGDRGRRPPQLYHYRAYRLDLTAQVADATQSRDAVSSAEPSNGIAGDDPS